LKNGQKTHQPFASTHVSRIFDKNKTPKLTCSQSQTLHQIQNNPETEKNIATMDEIW
jgi:hypothetical protein